jgi:hypothetical protein
MGLGKKMTIPAFLAHVTRDFLRYGKATGLLRALGATDTDFYSHNLFDDLLVLHTARPNLNPNNAGRNTDDTHIVSASASLSIDTLLRVTYDELQPVVKLWRRSW